MNVATATDGGGLPRVWIVDDEPAAAALAADLCAACGAEASVFRASSGYLEALRGADTPVVVVLDWRLEHELSAALFLATRHRFPLLRIICWTGSEANDLPSMLHDDLNTRIIQKAQGSGEFERALEWALATEAAERPSESRPA